MTVRIVGIDCAVNLTTASTTEIHQHAVVLGLAIGRIDTPRGRGRGGTRTASIICFFR